MLEPMSINFKQLLEELTPAKEPDREPVPIHMDKTLYREFSKFCQERNIKIGKLLERLIRETMNEAGKAPKK